MTKCRKISQRLFETVHSPCEDRFLTFFGHKCFARCRAHWGRNSGPLAQRAQMSLGGLSTLEGPRSPKWGRRRVKIVEKRVDLTRFWLRFGLFCAPEADAERAQELISNSFATLGPKGPNDTCSKARESQVSNLSDL